ncbi:MAG TPA: glycosyltransferase, partial [Cellvibrionaceae bacterium]|nr:glycosyltransferase [Cellvibrionaceae bacterium]
MSQRYLIMAGGTGGHVFPALAVAKALMAQGHQVEWLGTVRGLEAKVVPSAGIQLHCLNIAGVRGRGIRQL